MKITNCIICGTTVESKHGNKLYCDSHRILTDKLHLKTWWAKNKDRINEERRRNHINKDRIIQCKICGIDVVATGSKQCFCAFHARQVEAKKNNEWWKRHADKKREKYRRYASRHRNELKAHCRLWYEKNRNIVSEKSKLLYKSQPDKFKEKSKKWKKDNPDKVLKNCRNRRVRLKNLKHAFSCDEWKNKLNETQGYCPNCNKYVGIQNLTLDHIVPISKATTGFVYYIKDVQPLCNSCNSSKKSSIPKGMIPESPNLKLAGEQELN